MKYLLITLFTLALASCDSGEMTFRLMGKWKWAYICGGITGACSYVDEDTTRELEITRDKMIERWDDNTVTSTAYSISSTTNYEGYTEYKIQFDDGGSQRIKVTRNTAEIEAGEILIGYKR